MRAVGPKSILITQGELVNYGGSEIITLELAEHFNSLGSTVHILTSYTGLPIEKEFSKLKNVIIHTTTEGLDFLQFDLIWIHHQFIPEEIISLAEKGELNAKVIFHHMSPYHPLEFPFLANIEKRLADLVLFNSYETKRTIESKLEDIDFSGEVFNNPAPDYFRTSTNVRKYRNTLKRLLVVSNHIPDELTEAFTILQEQGVQTKAIGLNSGGSFKRVRPQDLQGADVVISIGKTVQYALQGGIPVYCYDHFGGPGYLSADNFKTAAELNFSGRGFNRKQPHEIAGELLSEYKAAQKFAVYAHKNLSEPYLLSYKIAEALTRLETTRKKEFTRLSATERSTYLSFLNQLWDFHKSYHSAAQAYMELSHLHTNLSEQHEQTVTKLEQEIAFLKQQLESTYSSKSWKLTEPLRLANKNLRRNSPSEE